MPPRRIGFGDPSNKDKGKKALERLFAPEFRNRLDAVVEFGGSRRRRSSAWWTSSSPSLDAQLLARRVTVQLTPAARQWLASAATTRPSARGPMARLIQTEIKARLADEKSLRAARDGGRSRSTRPDGLDVPLRAAQAPAPPASQPERRPHRRR